VAIIDHGTVLALDTPDALVRGMTGERTLDCTIEPGPDTDTVAVEAAITALPGVTQTDRLDVPGAGAWRLRIYVHGESATFVAPVAQAIGAAGGRLTDARLGEPNLEDVFIHLTGRALR
jgi:ABC-2 type transport system ATP-binding protein